MSKSEQLLPRRRKAAGPRVRRHLELSEACDKLLQKWEPYKSFDSFEML